MLQVIQGGLQKLLRGSQKLLLTTKESIVFNNSTFFGQKTYGKPLSQMPGETLVSNLEKKGLEKRPNKISRTEHCFNNW